MNDNYCLKFDGETFAEFKSSRAGMNAFRLCKVLLELAEIDPDKHFLVLVKEYC